MATGSRTFAAVNPPSCFSFSLCSSDRGKYRRLVRRPPGTQFKTLLSIDGGGIRGIIPTMVLQHLEHSIKEHISENKDTLIPKDFPHTVNTIDDFDVDLTDYFDLVAGTSVGSMLAVYVSGRGVGSDAILNNPDIRRRYPKMRRGNMETVRAVFHELSREIFPRRNIFDKIMSVFRALYPSSGIEGVLQKVFANATMRDLETGCLIASYDPIHFGATSFMRGPGEDGTLYTVRVKPRESPRQPTEQASQWKPDLHIEYHTNYYMT